MNWTFIIALLVVLGFIIGNILFLKYLDKRDMPKPSQPYQEDEFDEPWEQNNPKESTETQQTKTKDVEP